MQIPTWETRVLEILQTEPTLTSIKLAALTGLKKQRAASLLGKLAAYGRIKQVSRFQRSFDDNARKLSTYAALSCVALAKQERD